MNSIYLYKIDNLVSPARSFQKGYKIYKYPITENLSFIGESYYSSLKELIEKDPIYNSLSAKEKKLIILEKNIQVIIGMYLSPKNPELNVIEIIQHTIFGDVYNKKALGIHHIFGVENGFAKIEKITKQPNKLGVYEAELSRKDFRSKNDTSIKEWRTKKSTFFPDIWDINQIIVECLFAFLYKTKYKEFANSVLWRSSTISEVPVEIYTDKNERLQSIYPLYTR